MLLMAKRNILDTTETKPHTAFDLSSIAGKPGHGIDVSSHSGAVEWDTVAAHGFEFAFVKASEGVDLADPAFATHWQNLKRCGIVRGAYHFYVSEDDPEEQARLFTSLVALEPGDMAPVVDIETIGHDTQPGLPERLRKFLDILEAHYGIKPIIYTSANFWDKHLTSGFGDYPLWIAEYDVSTPRIPEGFADWHLWQWQGDAAVPGVEKSADISKSKGSIHNSTLLVQAD